jgi:hypothetical protein
MQRSIIGILALVLLAASLLSWVWPAAEAFVQFDGFCVRLGAILAVWWLAYPDLARLPAWILAGVPVLVIILARWPRFFWLFIPVVVVLAVLKPRWGRGK